MRYLRQRFPSLGLAEDNLNCTSQACNDAAGIVNASVDDYVEQLPEFNAGMRQLAEPLLFGAGTQQARQKAFQSSADRLYISARAQTNADRRAMARVEAALVKKDTRVIVLESTGKAGTDAWICGALRNPDVPSHETIFDRARRRGFQIIIVYPVSSLATLKSRIDSRFFRSLLDEKKDKAPRYSNKDVLPQSKREAWITAMILVLKGCIRLLLLYDGEARLGTCHLVDAIEAPSKSLI